MSFPHRTYCDSLAEARKILKLMNSFNLENSKHQLISLLEECQTYGDRMEAGLHYTRDINELHNRRSKLNKEIKGDI